MGAVATKCSDVSKTGPVKPLDAPSSEEEEEDPDDLEEEDSEEEDGEDAMEMAQTVLGEAMEGLKKGKTANFKEVIEHAAAIGIDQDKISKAEAKLEDHKNQRRREAFEAEITDYLDNEADNHTLEALQEKIDQGTGYGVSEKSLARLRERFEQLDVNRALDADETDQIKKFVQSCTRRFVIACLEGRDATWLDLQSGDRLPDVVLNVDVVLRSFGVQEKSSGRVIVECDFSELSASRPRDNTQVAMAEPFSSLPADEQTRCVAVACPNGPWCLIESDAKSAQETIVALTVLSKGGEAATSSPRTSPRGPKGKQRSSRSLRASKSNIEGDTLAAAPPPMSARGKKSSPRKESSPRSKDASPRSKDASPRTHSNNALESNEEAAPKSARGGKEKTVTIAEEEEAVEADEAEEAA